MTLKARGLAAIVGAVLAVVLLANPASAHTGFESSDPSDGDVIETPVDEIALTFSGEAAPAGEGFVILDSSGTIREPDEITTLDNLTWRLRFDEPLAGGDVGVRWMVAAPDAHPIDGSFSFTITAPSPGAVGPAQPGESSNAVAFGDLDPGTEENGVGANDAVPVDPEPAPDADATPVDLESFLESGNDEPIAADTVAAVARILSVVGALFVVGGVAFAAFGLRGDPSDVRVVLYWVRRGGVLLVLGAVGRAATTTVALAGDWFAVISPGSLGDALWSSTGFAIALRAGGGYLAASKTELETTTASAGGDPVVAGRRLAAVGGGHLGPPRAGRKPAEPFVYARDHVWDHRNSIGGLFGALLVAVSFMFDGHSASEGPRWLHAAANLTHVTTAAIWAGGVVMLTITIQRRRSSNRPTQALQLAMRFSVIATIAIVAAAVAGVALSVFVLDSVSEIWSTPWGRLLVLKVVLVAVAAGGGAYNHRVVVPSLDRTPSDPFVVDRLRSVVIFEAAVLVSVAVVTAFLVAASSA